MSEVDSTDAPAALSDNLVGEVDSVGDKTQGEEGNDEVGSNIPIPALLIMTSICVFVL